MLKMIEYNHEYRERWNGLAKEKGTLFHTIEWKEVLEDTFGYKSTYYLVVDGKDRVVGLLPIITERYFLLKRIGMSLPFVNYMDLCCRDEETHDFIMNELKKLPETLKVGYLEMRFKGRCEDEAADQTENSGHMSVDGHNYTFILPLDGDEEQVLSYSSGSNRNHTRKVYKNNTFSVSFEKKHLLAFYKVYCIRMKQLGSPSPDIIFFEKIMEKFPSHVTLLTVWDNGLKKLVGGMFLLSWGDTLYYQWGSGLTEYNRQYLNNYMYWEAVKFGIRNGFQYLDLGRSPYSEEKTGTYRYKQQWGAKPVQLRYCRFWGKQGKASGIESDTRPYIKPERDHSKLDWAVSIWKKLPAPVTDVAGKILIKYVMP